MLSKADCFYRFQVSGFRCQQRCWSPIDQFDRSLTCLRVSLKLTPDISYENSILKIPRRIIRPGGVVFGPDGCCFDGDVDAYRAPGDASSAAHTAGGAELIYPAGQFMGHPLAIPRLYRRSYVAAMNIRKIHGEAGIPASPAFGKPTRQIRHIFHGRAKAGRTNQGAIGA